MKKLFSFFALVIFMIPACNTKSKTKVSEVFVTKEGAINGYDAVAYFKENNPVKGNTKYMFEWKDATWYFSSEENLLAFKADPEKYAPQFGGYCAYGTAEGHKATTQPDAWTIVDDKLYLNYNKDVKTLWLEKQDEYIRHANANWPTVKLEPF